MFKLIKMRVVSIAKKYLFLDVRYRAMSYFGAIILLSYLAAILSPSKSSYLVQVCYFDFLCHFYFLEA